MSFSRLMKKWGGLSRFAEATQLLFEEGPGIAPALEEHFKVRYYSFEESALRVDSVQHVGPSGRGTNISAALDRVISDFKGVPLAGVVLMTDGGDNSSDVPLNQAEELRNLDVPLHIVGLGQPFFEHEREILEAVASQSVEESTGAEIEVKVRSWIDEDLPVTFSLFRGEEQVFSTTRHLKGGGKIDQMTFF